MSRIESLLEQNKALNREMLERQEEAWQREYKLLTSMEALQLHVTQLEKENAQLKANQSVVVADSLPQPASPSQPRSVGPPSLVPETVTDELQQITLPEELCLPEGCDLAALVDWVYPDLASNCGWAG